MVEWPGATNDRAKAISFANLCVLHQRQLKSRLATIPIHSNWECVTGRFKMMSRLSSPLRTTDLRAAIFSLAIMIAMALVTGSLAQSQMDGRQEKPPIEIDQITDVSAGDVYKMFRFSPALVRVPVGKTLRFLNSRGQHTVVSIKKMWPDGVPKANLANIRAADIRFNRPGLYGFTCKVHGRYGMVMLVAVGDQWPNRDAAKKGVPGGRAGERMRRLLTELEETN